MVRDVKPVNIYGRMGVRFGDNYMGHRKIIEWMERYSRGQTSADDACLEELVTVLS